MAVKTRPDIWIEKDDKRYKVIDYIKDKDYLLLLNEQTNMEFESKISKITHEGYKIIKEEGFVAPPPKKSRKAGKELSDKFKSEAVVWLQRMEQMLPELSAVAATDATKLGRAIKYLKGWIE